jgi:hypothetical protein
MDSMKQASVTAIARTKTQIEPASLKRYRHAGLVADSIEGAYQMQARMKSDIAPSMPEVILSFYCYGMTQDTLKQAKANSDTQYSPRGSISF